MYERRRYKVIDNKLQKHFRGDEPGWFVTKVEAWKAWDEWKNPPKPEPKPMQQEPPKRGRPKKVKVDDAT